MATIVAVASSLQRSIVRSTVDLGLSTRGSAPSRTNFSSAIAAIDQCLVRRAALHQHCYPAH